VATVVRELRPEDAPRCGAIVGATALWQRSGLDAERAARLLAAAVAGGDTVQVLEIDGTVAGFAWVDRRGAFGRSAYLRMIAIDPARRSAGLGAALMQAVDALAATQGPDAFLMVSDFNADAQRFYRRLGWAEVGRVPDYVLPGVTEIVMWKRVRPA
jgi:ribosomal protein S18 acetylase RimI-like enzyme